MRPLMRRCFISFVVMLAWLADASLPSAQIALPDAPGVFDPPNKKYTSGDAEEIDPVIFQNLPVVDRHRAFLPASVDLTSRMPLPGNQGEMGSCVAWAAAYAARSYYTSKLEGRDPRESRNVPSPNYAYLLTHARFKKHKGCPKGVSVDSVVAILKQGALSLAEYPYSGECAPPPSPQVVAKAFDFRVQGYDKVNITKIDDIKGQLHRGNPVLFAAATPKEFDDHRGDKTFKDSSIDIRGPDRQTKEMGWHEMVFIGYDDRRQAFRLLNSWGQNWGDRGYAWFHYDVFPKLVRDAGVLKVAEPKRPPPPKPPLIQPQPPAPPQPLPPPPPPPPGPRAQLSDLQNLSCGKVAAERLGARTVLTGFVSSLTDFELVQRVATNTINTSLGNLVVAPWPQCEALQTLEKPLAEIDQPKIAIGADEFRDGDTLRIEIQSPAQISYLYIAYIQADGSVVNLAQPTGLVPQPTLPNTALVFGDGEAGRAKFTVGPPYGREMIIALASRSPLFDDKLPAEQTEREYLTALRRALIYKPSADLPDREVSATITTLQTRAR